MTLLKYPNVTAQLNKILSVDSYTTSVYEIIDAIESLGSPYRKRILRLVSKALQREDCRKIETARISIIKILVALLPDSAEIIRHWIRRKNGASVYEMHFTLFCFLDVTQNTHNGRSFSKEVPQLIGSYLKETRSRSAMAAWMAGDLLGDHWENTSKAAGILLEAAKNGRYVAGRESALHGLSHIISTASLPLRRQIRSELKTISLKDRSSQIRQYARSILSGYSV